jgi:hypothetical protein
MIVKTIFFVISVAHGFVCLAQHLDYNRFELLKKNGSQTAVVDAQYDDIKGIAWSSSAWQPAVLVSDDGRRYADFRARIDLYKNVAYVKSGDTVYNINGTAITRIVLDAGQVDSVVFQKGVSGSGVRPEQYVQVLASGKLGLLKLRTMEVKDLHEDALSTVKAFVIQDYYYLMRPGGELEMVKPGRKLFEQEMGDKWPVVSQYAKAKDLSFNREEGWALLLTYYNSL